MRLQAAKHSSSGSVFSIQLFNKCRDYRRPKKVRSFAREFYFSVSQCSVQIAVSNTNVCGLRNFQVTKFEAVLFESRLSFGLTFPVLLFDGVHKTTAGLNGEALSGSGGFSVTAKSID